MNFFSRSTSKLLQGLGCVSESDMYYSATSSDLTRIKDEYVFDTLCPCVPAFTAFDLIGPSERARENARKWWGDGLAPLADNNELAYIFHRHALIDLPEDEVESYVLKTMKGERG